MAKGAAALGAPVRGAEGRTALGHPRATCAPASVRLGRIRAESVGLSIGREAAPRAEFRSGSGPGRKGDSASNPRGGATSVPHCRAEQAVTRCNVARQGSVTLSRRRQETPPLVLTKPSLDNCGPVRLDRGAPGLLSRGRRRQLESQQAAEGLPRGGRSRNAPLSGWRRHVSTVSADDERHA
jgi:hypothetical protein